MAHRHVHVALLPALIRRDSLDRSAVAVVDLLRASTTMVRAIESGAAAVRLVTEPADALRERDAMGKGAAVAAGERGGLAPEGFDLGNSPSAFTRESVGGKTVVFTTTNGTRMVTAVKSAAVVCVGCILNRTAAGARLARHDGPIMIACAGTDGRIAMEDCLGAGAIADAIVRADPSTELTDPAWACVWAWRGASADAATLAHAVRCSAGARNLERVGLGIDIDDCLRTDATACVPVWNGEAIVAG